MPASYLILSLRHRPGISDAKPTVGFALPRGGNKAKNQDAAPAAILIRRCADTRDRRLDRTGIGMSVFDNLRRPTIVEIISSLSFEYLDDPIHLFLEICEGINVDIRQC